MNNDIEIGRPIDLSDIPYEEIPREKWVKSKSRRNFFKDNIEKKRKLKMPNNIPYIDLDTNTKIVSFIMNSIQEEYEAVDYYNQRISELDFMAKNIPINEGSEELSIYKIINEIKNLLIHNRNEELEHATMLIEQFRRLVPDFNKSSQKYFFTESPLIEIEG